MPVIRSATDPIRVTNNETTKVATKVIRPIVKIHLPHDLGMLFANLDLIVARVMTKGAGIESQLGPGCLAMVARPNAGRGVVVPIWPTES